MSGKLVVEMVGNIMLSGLMIEQSNEIVVLFDEKNYLYIMRDHIRRLKQNTDVQDITSPEISQVVQGALTADQLLQKARNFTIELVVFPGKELRGTIGNILDDYFEFHTPLYKTLYIAKQHVKWLIPYEKINSVEKPIKQPKNTLIQQLDQLHGMYVQINQGIEGKITGIHNGMLELDHMRDEKSYINLRHIQVLWVDI